MSSGLSIYLLDLTKTRALIGSGDDQLLDVIRAEFGDHLAADDRYFESEIEQGAPTAYEALRAVVHGGPFSEDKNHAFQYAYAYKRLCELTGHFLDNSNFCPFRGDWLSVVDQGLTALGITAVSVASFDLGSLPDPLPWTYTPGYGEWTPEQCAQALEQFEETKRKGHAPPLEPEVVETVMDCIGWMRHAASRPGHGIAGFRS
ncbi:MULTISPECIES: hypothetical protein [Streptomyces]|uniref:DUF7691 domain-containing protein n=1 Tax=Streptomyces luteosporeus TaxID=173856 RepID=A0ABP6GPU1_9ACTN